MSKINRTPKERNPRTMEEINDLIKVVDISEICNISQDVIDLTMKHIYEERCNSPWGCLQHINMLMASLGIMPLNAIEMSPYTTITVVYGDDGVNGVRPYLWMGESIMNIFEGENIHRNDYFLRLSDDNHIFELTELFNLEYKRPSNNRRLMATWVRHKNNLDDKDKLRQTVIISRLLKIGRLDELNKLVSLVYPKIQ